MKKITALGSIFLATVLILFGGLSLNNVAGAQRAVQSGAVQNPTQDTNQVPAPGAGSKVNNTVEMPSISVDSVNINKQSYVSGEEVSGDFVVTNHSAFLLENTSYRVLVGENYEEVDATFKMTNSYLDATSLFSLGNIKPGETKKINFKYKIPSFLNSEKAAIQVNVYTNNAIILGSNSSNYVKIENDSQTVTFSDIKLVLSNGKEYNLTEGPTIYADKDPRTASLSVKMKNGSKTDISIEPNLATYNQQDRLKKTNTSSPVVRLKAGETKTVSIELPTMDYVSAVYFSEVMFINVENGEQIASRAGVRYIVGGDMATIHSVQVDKNNVKAGDNIKLDYVVTGKPADIANVIATSTLQGNMADAYLVKTLNALTKKEGKVSIKLVNESDELVAEISEPINLYGDNKGSIQVLASESAKAMKALVFIHNEEGFVFLKKEIYLSGDFDKIATEEAFKKNAVAAGSIVLLVIVLFAAYIMYRKNKISGSTLSVIVVLGAVAIPTVAGAWVWTGTTYSCSIEEYGAPSLSVSTPYNNQTYIEGSTFSWSGYVYHQSCSNSTNYLVLNFYNNATGESGNRIFHTNYASGGHYIWWENSYFKTRKLSVGSKPGYYNISFWISDGCYIQYGYVPYRVICASGKVQNSSGYCAYPSTQTNSDSSGGTNGTSGGDTSSGSMSSTYTTGDTAYAAACGTQANSNVAKGSVVDTNNLCATGNSLSGNVSFNYLNNEWRWTCSGTNSDTATCKTSCASGTYSCPASNKCSDKNDCTDWCSNVAGNQTDRSKYIVNQDGLCYEPKFITDFKLNPSISNSQGVCKVFWSTRNPLDDGTLTCKINGAPVSCINDTTGLDVVPGTTKLEAILDFASSTYTDFKELRCTQNPNLIEI